MIIIEESYLQTFLHRPKAARLSPIQPLDFVSNFLNQYNLTAKNAMSSIKFSFSGFENCPQKPLKILILLISRRCHTFNHSRHLFPIILTHD